MRGRPVGRVVVRFTGSGLGGADRSLEIALLRAISGAAGVAALGALLTGLAVARRITRPVERIIAVTRAMGGGERTARVGQVAAPAELRELATAFDQMADALARQEQLRRDLVADVAHELRTPVAVLQAGHEAMLDGVAEPTAEQLASLRDEVLRLANMVNDLQTLAAADAATLHLSPQPCDLAALADDAVASLIGRFDAAGISLEQRFAEADVLADPRWLHQLITNLLTNALKFTPEGGRVTVEARLAGPQAVLTVTDTGMGIPADELPQVFNRFWRGRGAAQISGSGIGLAVAAELAQAHGGQLTASSEAGQGTVMTLTLPRAQRIAGGARLPPKRLAKRRPPSCSRRSCPPLDRRMATHASLTGTACYPRGRHPVVAAAARPRAQAHTRAVQPGCRPYVRDVEPGHNRPKMAQSGEQRMRKTRRSSGEYLGRSGDGGGTLWLPRRPVCPGVNPDAEGTLGLSRGTGRLAGACRHSQDGQAPDPPGGTCCTGR